MKSWRITRAGMNGISASAGGPGRHAASVSTSSGADDAAAGVAEHVLEQDLDRDGGAVAVDPVVQDRQPVDVREAVAEASSGRRTGRSRRQRVHPRWLATLDACKRTAPARRPRAGDR